MINTVNQIEISHNYQLHIYRLIKTALCENSDHEDIYVIRSGKEISYTSKIKYNAI